MCLHITTPTHPVRFVNGKATVYKVVDKQMRSVFMGEKYELGEECLSSRKDNKLSLMEMNRQVIYAGCHTFNNLEEARDFAGTVDIILECTASQEDFVGEGEFSWGDAYSASVWTKVVSQRVVA